MVYVNDDFFLFIFAKRGLLRNMTSASIGLIVKDRPIIIPYIFFFLFPSDNKSDHKLRKKSKLYRNQWRCSFCHLARKIIRKRHHAPSPHARLWYPERIFWFVTHGWRKRTRVIPDFNDSYICISLSGWGWPILVGSWQTDEAEEAAVPRDLLQPIAASLRVAPSVRDATITVDHCVSSCDKRTPVHSSRRLKKSFFFFCISIYLCHSEIYSFRSSSTYPPLDKLSWGLWAFVEVVW